MRTSTGIVRKRKHKKILKATKGFRMSKSKLYKVAHEAFMHAGKYAYNDRKKRATQVRSLWIKRLNAASKENGINYSTLIKKLNDSKITLNKKILAKIVLEWPEVFSQIVKSF